MDWSLGEMILIILQAQAPAQHFGNWPLDSDRSARSRRFLLQFELSSNRTLNLNVVTLLSIGHSNGLQP